MQTDNALKEIVKQKYSEIALQDKATNQSSCCGAGGCSTEVYNIMSDDYTSLEGYNADADLGLGCGLPTQFAKIKKGDVVIDLGSGAGNDAFIARAETGEDGKVIGIDFTPAMIEKAKALIVVIPDSFEAVRIVDAAKSIRPDIKIIVVDRYHNYDEQVFERHPVDLKVKSYEEVGRRILTYIHDMKI